MPTPQAALKKMREICLALPDTSEAAHFGETCFRVGKRMFASCGDKAGQHRLVFQLRPEHASQLLDSDPRFTRYPRQANCVVMDANGVEDWAEVRARVLESYRLNAPAARPPAKAAAPRGKSIATKREAK